MRKAFLVEDHDAAFKIWKNKNIKGLDLIHLDAHMDFGFFKARPLERLINEAKNVKDLKKSLEYTLSFLHYERDLSKQINIGNYVYPAIEEGIVNNFYWVVPGKSKEFKESRKAIKGILRRISKRQDEKKIVLEDDREDIISTRLFGRRIIVCNLDNLPVLTKAVLLDIDVDFLVIDSVLGASNIKDGTKRRPWILPGDLADLLREKVKVPAVTTISYSVNGGWTPIRYKHFGDELAFNLAPSDQELRRRFEVKQKAARYFALFDSTNKKEYYQKAVRLDPTYRCPDNNYGPLYLSRRRFSLAQKEFKRIFRVDRFNTGAILGLGDIALQRKDFKKAREYFSSALLCRDHGLFYKTRQEALFALAKAEFNLGNFSRTKELLLRLKAFYPLKSEIRCLLGRIYEKEKNFAKAALFYKDAIRLALDSIEPIFRLLKVSAYLKEKSDIIKYASAEYNKFKRGFVREARLIRRERGNAPGICKIEKKMAALEKRLGKITYL